MSRVLLAVLSSAHGFLLPGLPLRAPPLRVPSCTCCASPGDYDAALAKCREMRASELKAELDLRGISYAGMVEKDELAQALARARSDGRADPSVIDAFNKQSAEAAFRSDDDAVVDVGADSAVASPADAAAADGSLPGGMSMGEVEKLSQNPELMAMLRNPKMQEVMKKVMENGPQGLEELTTDPEVREMLKKASELTGQ